MQSNTKLIPLQVSSFVQCKATCSFLPWEENLLQVTFSLLQPGRKHKGRFLSLLKVSCCEINVKQSNKIGQKYNVYTFIFWSSRSLFWNFSSPSTPHFNFQTLKSSRTPCLTLRAFQLLSKFQYKILQILKGREKRPEPHPITNHSLSHYLYYQGLD